jgi:hypothetical protein
MPAENESIKCLRCGSALVIDEPFYIIPHNKHRGNPPDDSVVNIKSGRLLRLFRCHTPECHYVELQSSTGWMPMKLG